MRSWVLVLGVFFWGMMSGLTLARWNDARASTWRPAAEPASSRPDPSPPDGVAFPGGIVLPRSVVLRTQAVAGLPPDASDVEVVREEPTDGWLTFARLSDGVRTKYLVCYKRDGSGGVSLSIARAD